MTSKTKISESKLTSSKTADEWPAVDWQAFRPSVVIGVDEVGRGCLAGPVVAGAAWIPAEHVEALEKAGVTDSKALTPKRRDELFDFILERAIVRLGWADSDEIDEINILQANFRAMERALVSLYEDLGDERTSTGVHIAVDGNAVIPFRGFEFVGRDSFEVLRRSPQTTIIKGDLRVLPIAAASIVAKVTRDRWMRDADSAYPGYEFGQHKGYASQVHREAIMRLGPSRIHRKTFGGVREHVR